MDRFDPTNPRVLAFDCECTHLHGPAFAIGAMVLGRDWRKPIAHFGMRCDPPEEPCPWVKLNVLPQIEHLHHAPRRRILEEFAHFVQVYRGGAIMVADVAWPCETRLLSEMVAEVPGFTQSGPYPLYDLANILADHGVDPDIDREELLDPSFFWSMGGPDRKHNPVFDAAVTAVATLQYLLHQGRTA